MTSPAAPLRAPPARAATTRSALHRSLVPLPGRDVSVAVVTNFGPLLSPPSPGDGPLLLLLPGAFHGTWAFERWLARLPRRAAAVAPRGPDSAPPPPPPPAPRLPAADGLADLVALLAALPGPPPVLVAHSAASLQAQQLLQTKGAAVVSGMVLVSAGVPGVGMARLERRHGAAWPGLRARMFAREHLRDLAFCRELYFTRAGVARDEAAESDAMVTGWMREMRRAAEAGGVAVAEGAVRPSPEALRDAMRGRVLVVGGSEDFFLAREDLEEVAEFWRCASPPVVVRGAPHDVMLATGWEEAADALAEWADKTLSGVAAGYGAL